MINSSRKNTVNMFYMGQKANKKLMFYVVPVYLSLFLQLFK